MPDRWAMARLDREEVFRVSDRRHHEIPLVINLFSDVELRGRIKNEKSQQGSTFISGSLEDGGILLFFSIKAEIFEGSFTQVKVFTV